MSHCEFCGQPCPGGTVCKDYVGCAKRMLDAMRAPGWNIFEVVKPKPALKLVKGGRDESLD